MYFTDAYTKAPLLDEPKLRKGRARKGAALLVLWVRQLEFYRPQRTML
jgi:hypothetical protein